MSTRAWAFRKNLWASQDNLKCSLCSGCMCSALGPMAWTDDLERKTAECEFVHSELFNDTDTIHCTYASELTSRNNHQCQWLAVWNAHHDDKSITGLPGPDAFSDSVPIFKSKAHVDSYAWTIVRQDISIELDYMIITWHVCYALETWCWPGVDVSRGSTVVAT